LQHQWMIKILVCPTKSISVLLVEVLSCCASNLHNLDGHLARPTRNVINGNLQVKCATPYQLSGRTLSFLAQPYATAK
jgi:hypothetical protein